MQQTRLESISWADTSAFIDKFFSWTKDAGTERRVGDAYFDNLDTFSYWCTQAEAQCGDDGVDVKELMWAGIYRQLD